MQDMFYLGKFLVDESFQLCQRKSRLGGGEFRFDEDFHEITTFLALGAITVRSALGASANRLEHVYNNLSNISTNSKAATGRIMDVDYAAESANMTSAQMLLQASTAMLKQSQSMQKMILSLLQP